MYDKDLHKESLWFLGIEFLEQILADLKLLVLGFKWIMKCVTIVTYSMMVNRKHTRPFYAKREVRQGEPLSQYVFVLARVALPEY